MSILFVTKHNKGGVETITVTDMSTGDVASLSSNIADYEEKKKSILEIVKNGSSMEEVKRIVFNYNAAENMENLRKELGITLSDNGEITLPNGVNLPAGVSAIFNDMTDREHGERLIKFSELLMQNKREHAREALVDWILKNPSLSILEDGRIMGYRGLRNDMTSIHFGYAIVNGEEVNGHVDNTPGNIIEFPEHLIDHNPNNFCSVGLHVGTKIFAINYGARFVHVAFSPADVVSPPRDAAQNKIRVSKMEILDEFFI